MGVQVGIRIEATLLLFYDLDTRELLRTRTNPFTPESDRGTGRRADRSVRLAGTDGEVAAVVFSRAGSSHRGREGHVMVQANDYDSFAEAYSADNETNLVNGHYERPAMLNLVGDARGRRILDAGCGSGPLAAALRARGAVVTGFDRSVAMVDLARRRLGADAELHVADLSEPLPFADDGFDDVVASLVLHYLPDWTAPLAELRRVLRPGGRLILSVHHPIIFKVLNPDADYFAISEWSEEYTFSGQPAVLAYWHRPLHAMTDAFTSAGFRIAAVSEPPFSPDTPRELLPPQLGNRTSFLSFIFFVLERVSEPARQWRVGR